MEGGEIQTGGIGGIQTGGIGGIQTGGIGATPLWIAAQMGHHDIVSLLLKAGAKEFILTFLVLAGICIFYLYCK